MTQAMSRTEAEKVLEKQLFQEAAEGAQRSARHDSRFAFVAAGSWQADMLRRTRDVAIVLTPEALRAVMAKSAPAVVFLPQEAFMSMEILEKICAETSFGKLIIQERPRD
jgi:hypothetical protein